MGKLGKILKSFSKVKNELTSLLNENKAEIKAAETHVASLKGDNSQIEAILNSDFMKHLGDK